MKKVLTISPLYRRLMHYVKPYRGRLVAAIVVGALYGPTNAAVLSVVQQLWAQIFEQKPDSQVSWWFAIGGALLLPLTMLARGLCDFGTTYLMNWVGMRAVMDLRIAVFAHLQKLSLDYFTGTRTGELISRVTNDVSLVQQSMSNVIADFVKEPVTMVCVLGWLLYKDWKLTVVGLLLFPACIVPIVLYGRRTRKASRATQAFFASLVSVLHEALVGLRVVKAFGMEKRETAEFTNICRNVFRQWMRVIRAKAVTTPMIEVLAGIGGMFVCIYAFYQHQPASVIVPYGLGLFLLYNPVKKLSRVHMHIQESMAAAERIFRVLDEIPTVLEAPAARVLPPLSQTITFDHVTFRYEQAEQDGRRLVLDDIHVEIPRGSLTAIVGASGAGKTTMFNLIPRFYDPARGAVRIDGVDIREVTFQSLRGQIGLVTQETFLFNDTVGANIAYGKPGATQEEIIAAAKRAHAHDFIAQMPQQYDTPIGESGVKLSGGQRQRLAIARAILRNPPILLLDEATSALDTESERVVQAALDDLMWGGKQDKNHTMLVIAHRLSTVRHADRIIVLDKGRVVEQGTHDELLALGQVYQRLHDLQFNA